MSRNMDNVKYLQDFFKVKCAMRHIYCTEKVKYCDVCDNRCILEKLTPQTAGKLKLSDLLGDKERGGKKC